MTTLTTLLYLIVFVNVTHADNCEVTRRCAPFIHRVPSCTTNPDQKDELVMCLKNVLSDCHSHPEASRHIGFTKLSNRLFCKNQYLAQDFHNNSICWTEMKPCILLFGDFKLQLPLKSHLERQNSCREAKYIRDKCLSRDGVMTNCRFMENKFISMAFEEMECESKGMLDHGVVNHRINWFLSIFLFIFVGFVL